jgi:hypothetical protein
MALTAKPARPSPSATVHKVENFINGGGSVAVSVTSPATPTKAPQHPLKFPDPDLFARLEAARKATPVTLPRNTWILQAIAEKLERESQ